MSDVATMIEIAYRNVAAALDPDERGRAVAEIAQALSEWDICEIIPASAAAESLYAVLSAAINTSLEPPDDAAHPVALFDINFASGTEFARAASQARLRGATAVYGVALHQLGVDGPTAADCGLDALRVVKPRPQPEQISGSSDQSIYSSGLST